MRKSENRAVLRKLACSRFSQNPIRTSKCQSVRGAFPCRMVMLPVRFCGSLSWRIVIRHPLGSFVHPSSGSVSYLSLTIALASFPNPRPLPEPPPAVPILPRPLDFLQNDSRAVRYAPVHFP